MSGDLLGAWLADETGQNIARLGALLSHPKGGLWGVTAIAPLARRGVGTLYWRGAAVGRWREFEQQDCESPDIRNVCALVELDPALPEHLRDVAEPLMPQACALEKTFGERVRIRGTDWLGKVHMRRRPVHFTRRGAAVLLTETLAVKFEEDASLNLDPGRLVVTDCRCEPLGIVIGGTSAYCLLSPIALLLASSKFKLAHREVPSAKLIQDVAERQEKELGEQLEEWSNAIPEWARAA